MTKRKAAIESKAEELEMEESSSANSDNDMEMNELKVEFEWFDPQPENDFHGIKTLLRQLLDADAPSFDLSALTDLILAQPLLGSTVKVDGNLTDPWAFLTILNLQEHKDKPVIHSLVDYIATQATFNTELMPLKDLLEPTNPARVGLVLTERFLNCPSEVVPPMYRMLEEEISWALEDKEPYNFSHYLVLSKSYTEVASKLDEEDSQAQRKKKQKTSANTEKSPTMFHFHPEDEVLQRHASLYGGFDYLKQEGEGQSDAKRTFQDLGVKPRGHLILIEGAKFGAVVKSLEGYFGQN